MVDPAIILADSPEGYWPLTADANDASPNANHLSIYEAGTSEFGWYEPFGQYGHRGTVVYDTGVSLSGDWTIEFMVERKQPAYAPNQNSIAADGTDEESGAGAWASGSTGHLSWGGAGFTFSSYEGLGIAHHYIAVRSGGSVTVYRAASLWGDTPTSIDKTWVLADAAPSGGTLKIGNAGGAMYAHVSVYDHALSIDRIQAHLLGESLTPGPEPDHDVLDPLDDDGPLGDSTPTYGYGWLEAAGSLTVASNEVSSSDTYAFALLDLYGPPADPPNPCLTPPLTLSMTIDLAVDLDANIFLGWDGDDYPMGAIVYPSSVAVGRWSFADYDSAAADTTAGTHTLTVSFDPNTATLQAWWDGTWIAGAVEPIHFSAWVDLYNGAEPCLMAPAFGHDSNSGGDLITYSAFGFLVGPNEYGGLEAPALEGGVVRLTGRDDNLYVGGLEAPELDGGVMAPINPDLLREVYVGGLEAPALTGGVLYSYSNPGPPGPGPGPIYPDPPIPPDTPGYAYGPPSADLLVSGYPNRKTADVNIQLNGGGRGSFETLPPGPALDEEVTISASTALFTGYAQPSNHEVAPGEEDAQTISVDLVSLLEEDWTSTVVWPDIAASEPFRLGRPPQDDRTWDWHSNAGVYDRADLASSVGSNNALYGTDDEFLPFPDNWPDPYSEWMWDRNPANGDAPAGWVYFRVPFGLLFAKDVGIFLCAWDYATLSIDGQQFIVADQPGATFRHDLSFDWDYHLVTIAAYTEGGTAGVNCSIMPKEKHGFTPSVMNSRGGWEMLAYPEQPLRFTVGKVLERLVIEAKDRGAPAGDWTLKFDKDTDSAGNPWPTDDSVISTRVGMTYWDVLNMLAEDRIDFRASPYGRELYAYVKGQPGQSSSMPWAAGVDLADLVRDQTSQ